MCVSVCTVTNGGDAFSVTTASGPTPANPAAPTAAELAAIAAVAPNSVIGTAAGAPAVATCQYDFLLIAGAADLNNIAAERYCGNALNPAPVGVATSIQICSKIKPNAYFIYNSKNF